MKKYPVMALAVAAAVMITACSSVLNRLGAWNAGSDPAQESEASDPQSDIIKIESETDPIAPSTSEVQREALPAESAKGGTEIPPSYPVTAVQKTMYVTQPVHVRAACTTKSDVLTSFGTGRKVTVTGQSSNGWMRISYHGHEAYIYKKYLSGSEVVESKAKESKDKESKDKESKEKETSAAASSDNTQPERSGANSPEEQTPLPSAETSTGTDGSIPIVEPPPSTAAVDTASAAR